MRILAMFVSLLSALASVEVAHAQLREEWLNPFDLEFSADPPGGKNAFGESPRVNDGFLNGSGLLSASYQIDSAYRTEDFGSGVAVMVSDAEGQSFVKVGFEDPEGYDSVWFFMTKVVHINGEPRTESIGAYELDVGANEVGTVELELLDDDRLIARSDGASIEVELGFEPARVVAQVFCAKGWVRFHEGRPVA